MSNEQRVTPVYKFFENEEGRLMVARALEPLLPLLPAWVLEVNVESYQSQADGSVLRCGLQVDYRRFNLDVYSDFYGYEAWRQQDFVVHEFYHAVLGESHNWVRDRLVSFVKERNHELGCVMDAEFTERCERVVQELTFMTRAVLLAKSIPGTFGRRLGRAGSTINKGEVVRWEVDGTVHPLQTRPWGASDE